MVPVFKNVGKMSTRKIHQLALSLCLVQSLKGFEITDLLIILRNVAFLTFSIV